MYALLGMSASFLHRVYHLLSHLATYAESAPNIHSPYAVTFYIGPALLPTAYVVRSLRSVYLQSVFSNNLAKARTIFCPRMQTSGPTFGI